MKDKDRVSQAGIDSFVKNTTSIVRTTVEILKSVLMNRLDSAGKDFSAVPGLPEHFQDDSLALNPFSGLAKRNGKNEFFKDHSNLVVSYLVIKNKVKENNKLLEIEIMHQSMLSLRDGGKGIPRGT